MLTPEFYVLELRLEMHVNDLRSFFSEKDPQNSPTQIGVRQGLRALHK